MAALTLCVAAAGLAAATALVTAGSNPEPPAAQLEAQVCQDARTGAVHVHPTGRCAAKAQVEVAQGNR